jgi:hypothetical protein
MATIPVKQPLPEQRPETVEERFRRLAAAWHKAVAHHSSTTVRNNHPAYREIIGLGLEVVPSGHSPARGPAAPWRPLDQ